MTDTELISAIRAVVSEELKPVNARLDGIDARLDGLDTRADGIDTRIDKMDKTIKAMNTKFSIELGTLRCQMDDMQKDIKYLKEYPYNVESRLSKVEQDQIEIFSMIGKLESKHA